MKWKEEFGAIRNTIFMQTYVTVRSQKMLFSDPLNFKTMPCENGKEYEALNVMFFIPHWDLSAYQIWTNSPEGGGLRPPFGELAWNDHLIKSNLLRCTSLLFFHSQIECREGTTTGWSRGQYWCSKYLYSNSGGGVEHVKRNPFKSLPYYDTVMVRFLCT